MITEHHAYELAGGDRGDQGGDCRQALYRGGQQDHRERERGRACVHMCMCLYVAVVCVCIRAKAFCLMCVKMQKLSSMCKCKSLSSRPPPSARPLTDKQCKYAQVEKIVYEDRIVTKEVQGPTVYVEKVYIVASYSCVSLHSTSSAL